MPFSPELLQPLMMMAGLGIFCWLLLRGRATRSLKRRSQRLGAEPPRPAATAPLRHNANAKMKSESFSGTASLGAPVEVLKWQVELHDLGRELKGELDSKLIAVRSMTQAYDQASERLRGLIRVAASVSSPASSPLQQAQRLAARGWSEAKIAQTLAMSEADVVTLLQLTAESAAPHE